MDGKYQQSFWSPTFARAEVGAIGKADALIRISGGSRFLKLSTASSEFSSSGDSFYG